MKTTNPDIKENIELLMPAGDLEKAKYAFAFGADAIYAGVPMFALRAKENKFDTKDVNEIINYAHGLGKKVYLTTNIYPHNEKIPGFIKAMEQMVELQPDAFIVSDPGVIQLIRERWGPKKDKTKPSSKENGVELHLSVQQNNVNYMSPKFWKQSADITRIILARELSLREVKEITTKNPDIEFEYFIHGAMCMAYSGRCLLSNYMAGRDANQGVCAQSCRWSYKVYKDDAPDYADRSGRPREEHLKEVEAGEYVVEEKLRPKEYNPISEDEWGTYIFNSRDMCMVEYVEDIMKAGVCSLKVEGRNKSVYYAAIVAKVYREAIDKILSGEKPDTKKLLAELQSTSNRGFIPGFLTGYPGAAAQKYDANDIYQTHFFAGKLLKYDKEKNIAEFEVRNRIDVGDELEIITPTKQFTHTITEMTNDKGEEKTTIHPGTGSFIIKLDAEKEERIDSEFCIARIKGTQKRKDFVSVMKA